MERTAPVRLYGLLAEHQKLGPTPPARKPSGGVAVEVRGVRHSYDDAVEVALARIALADPPIVVLDEASAEAGSAHARELDEAVTALARGRTAIVIAHRLSQARACDQILVMDDGRITEQGTHDELLARSGRYAALWSAWAVRERRVPRSAGLVSAA